MSVIVYDGRAKILAADRLRSAGDMIMPGSKIQPLGFGKKDKDIVAWTGGVAEALMVIDWIQSSGSLPWPNCQHGDNWTRVIVANDHECYFYEQEPVKIHVPPDGFMAWGAGRDFAMGALAAGATARQAIEIASQYCAWVGFGVEVYYLKLGVMVI